MGDKDISYKRVFTTDRERKYFKVFAKYRKKYAHSIIDRIGNGDAEDINKKIATLNAKLQKKLLKIDGKNTSEHLYTVLGSLLSEDYLDQKDKELIQYDPLFLWLIATDKKPKVTPSKKLTHISKKLTHIIEIKDMIDALVGSNK